MQPWVGGQQTDRVVMKGVAAANMAIDTKTQQSRFA